MKSTAMQQLRDKLNDTVISKDGPTEYLLALKTEDEGLSTKGILEKPLTK